MKALIATLNDAERNLERAIDALADAYRCNLPHRCITGLSQGVTNCRAIRDAVREELDSAVAIEAGAVEPTVDAEPGAETVTITVEELDNLVWLAQNQMMDVERHNPNPGGAAGSERAIRKVLLERSAQTLRETRAPLQAVA
jgi:hypothetical protein